MVWRTYMGTMQSGRSALSLMMGLSTCNDIKDLDHHVSCHGQCIWVVYMNKFKKKSY